MFVFQQGEKIMKEYLKVLRNTPFFKGLEDDEILSILHCVNATIVSKTANSYIFKAGDITDVMGLVLSGSTLIIQEDLWGHRNILSKCNVGDFFGEPYAANNAVLNISVVANEDSIILLLNINHLLSTCPSSCIHHQKLIHNLVGVLSNKILILNNKITHTSKRTTRENYYHIYLANLLNKVLYPLISPLIVNNLLIIYVLKERLCQMNYQNL